MRRWAFVIVVAGLFVLLLMLNSKPEEVGSYEDLEEMEINTRVLVAGSVVEERVIYSGTKILDLNNGVELVCECVESLDGKEVEVLGVVSDYEGKKQVEVLKIKFK